MSNDLDFKPADFVPRFSLKRLRREQAGRHRKFVAVVIAVVAAGAIVGTGIGGAAFFILRPARLPPALTDTAQERAFKEKMGAFVEEGRAFVKIGDSGGTFADLFRHADTMTDAFGKIPDVPPDNPRLAAANRHAAAALELAKGLRADFDKKVELEIRKKRYAEVYETRADLKAQWEESYVAVLARIHELPARIRWHLDSVDSYLAG